MIKMMNNPKTIAYQEMRKMFEDELDIHDSDDTLSGKAVYADLGFIQSLVLQSYLHQLEEEVKRLKKKKAKFPVPFKGLERDFTPDGLGQEGYRACIDSEIAIRLEAIKEIKALQGHQCCDGECNHDDCCGKIKENCRYKCKCHE